MYVFLYVSIAASIFSAFMPNWQQVDADVAEHGLPGYLLLIIVAAALIT
jgi:hypothetical protein